MARVRRTTAEPPVVEEKGGFSLVAAGRMLSGSQDITKASRTGTAWQRRAWEFYDTVGEFRYLCDQMGAGLAKGRLLVRKDGKEVTDPNDPAVALLHSLYGHPERHPEMLAAFGTNLTAGGDCYLFGVEKNGRDKWYVVPATEVTRDKNGKWAVKGIDLGSSPFRLRLWRPHPRKHSDSNAPSRAVLPILSEIEGLTKHVAAQIDSRLASAGLLLIPEEFTFGGLGNADGQASNNQADVFLKFMVEVMQTAIKDRESASALVPIPIQGPGEHMDSWRHLTFWSELSEQAIALRTEAVRRLALGMDFPPELLLGTGESNHWTAAWQDESAIKSHILPMADLVAQSLTEGYLYPLLIAEGAVDEEEAERYSIGVDTSEIRLRPNRSREALELYDRGEINAKALLREVGFSDEDAMSDEERTAWLLLKVAQGQTTPDIVAQALGLMGVQVVSEETVQHEARPTPTLEEHPQRRLVPESQDTSALHAASEMAVFRALELAGNRLKARHNGRVVEGVAKSEVYRYYPCDAKALDYILEGAWSSLAQFSMCRSGKVDQQALSRVLDDYTRVLIREQAPHDPALLAQYLALLAPTPSTVEGA